MDDRFFPCFRGADLGLAAALSGLRHFIFQFDGGYFRGVPAPAFLDERPELYLPIGEFHQLGFQFGRHTWRGLALQDEKFQSQAKQTSGLSAGLTTDATICIRHFSLAKVEYDFWGETFSFSTPAMFLLALIVGVIGGIYGIGGGAIIAPFCVALFRLPVYTVAGAALAGTLVTSIAGVLLYSLLPAPAGMTTHPDWALGLLFGVGGFFGMYLGARCQKFVAQKTLKLLLGSLLVILALQYIISFAAR